MTSNRIKFLLYISVLLCSVAPQENIITQITNKSFIYSVCEHNVDPVMSTFPPLKKSQDANSLKNTNFWKNDDWITKKSGGLKRRASVEKSRQHFDAIKKTDLFFDASEIPVSFSICGTNRIDLFAFYMNGSYKHIPEPVDNQKWNTFTFVSKDGYTYYIKNNKIQERFQSLSRLVANTQEDAFFRIQEYEYKEAMYVNRQGSSTILRIPNSKKSCLMVYVSLCKSCVLRIEVREDSLNISSSIKEIYSLEQWQACKIKINVSVSDEVKFTRVKQYSTEKGYWKLDVRLYDENDLECGNRRWSLNYDKKCDSDSMSCNNKTGECFFKPNLHQSTLSEIINIGKISSPTIIGATRAKFTLSKNDFFNSTKEIIAYALILFKEFIDLNNTRNYGIWNGTILTWPTSPSNSLQLTPPFWNPFKGEMITCNFIIGANNSCCDKYCYNKPLKPNTKYWLMVRVFTRTAYNDSDLLYFQTDGFTNETTIVKTTLSPEINHKTFSSNDLTTDETATTSNKNYYIPSEDIIAYELFLFKTPLDFTSTHGLWDGTNNTWPSKPKQSLQLTPEFWNPFKVGADANRDETYYNTSLEPNTKYWLMMRALTHTTYRDSSLLYFHTGNLTSEKTTSPYPQSCSEHSLFNETITFANLSAPSSNQSSRAHFILSEDDVIPSSGEIIAYAIFLFKLKPINVSNITWGYWNGTTRTWPSWPNNSVQITPPYWNPFNGKIHSCNFTIGADNSCCKKYCNNEPLEPNTNYWMMMRALTHTVYNDSAVLHFQTGLAITSGFNAFYVLLPILLGILSTMVLIAHRILRKKFRRNTVDNEGEHLLLLNLNHESTVLDFAHFENYCSQNSFLIALRKQFNIILDTTQHYSSTTGLRSKNINKNRDRDQIVPYDYNRVILKPMTGVGTEDYINASYINGYSNSKAYIACQSPKYYTVRDFWRMIWQENVSTIVMATNFVEYKKRMCAEYWPPIESTVFECGEMIIKLITETTSEHYDCQKFEIVYNNITRDILQFHLKWNTDSNIFYPNNVLPVVKHIRQRYNNNSGPIVFHSGYGTGRTAILILCELALEMIKTENKIDFFTLTKELRMQRPLMISNLEHYVLSHLIVNEYFTEEKSPFKYSLEKNIDTDDIKQQLKYVEILSRHDSLMQYLVPQNKIKPYSFQNMLVRRYGNAKNYLISQEPYENQDIQFWKMVAIESVHCIFFVNKKFPLRNCRCVTATEVMKVNYTQIAEESHYRVLQVSLLMYQKVSKRITYDKKICVFEYKDWKPKQLIPISINKFVSIVNKIHKNVKDEKHVLISCSDGYTASGLFVVLSYIIEKYEKEIEIDVCNAIRIARRDGKLFVNKPKQLTFIYRCIKEYIQNYEKYQQVDV